MTSRVRSRVWILLCVMIAGTIHAQVMDESAVKSKIVALENVWNQAEMLHDTKSLDALFDRDLVYIDTDGALLTKTELLARVGSEHFQSLSTEMTSIQILEDTAIVNGTYRVKELRNGKVSVYEGRFTDTWMYRGSSWLCIAAQATPQSARGY